MRFRQNILLTVILAGLLAVAADLRAGTLTFTYDAADRLVQINYGGTTNTSLTYDNDGNLLAIATFTTAGTNLAVLQSAAPNPVSVGGRVTFSITALNDSSSTATGVFVTNQLPANATLLSTTQSQGTLTQNGSVLTWNVGSLTSAAGAALNITLRALSAGSLTNTARVNGLSLDPFAANNSSTSVVSVLPAPSLAGFSSAGSITLAWPVLAGTDFTVQYATNLTPPVVWLPATGSPYIFLDHLYFSEPTSASGRFYRLYLPP